MLSSKVPLLEQEINNLKLVDSLRTSVDSLRITEISRLNTNVNNLSATVKEQKVKIIKRNWLLVGSGGIIICLLLLL